MLQSQNSEVFSVIEVPPFRPSLRDSLNNCQTRRGLTVCVLTKKKDFVATIECEKIRQKPRYTVNEMLLTKNSLRAPFVARNNSLLMLHWRPTLCGGKKKKTKTQGKSFLFLFLSKNGIAGFHCHAIQNRSK